LTHTIGGMAQWLGRWSLAGGLYLMTCDHFVGKVSAMGQPTRASIPPGSVNE